MQRAELTTVVPGTSLPMNAMWRTIRSYILWQHERGTLHYDIMVTLILIFIFFSPRVINFNDKPDLPESASDRSDRDFRYGRTAGLPGFSKRGDPGDNGAIRDQLLHIIEPISGAVSIVSYEAVLDNKGKVQSYKVLATRE